MKLTLCYVTSRREPHWEWFVTSLLAQTTPEQRRDIQVVFVDGKLWYPGARVLMEKYPSMSVMALAHHFYHDPRRRFDLESVVAKRFDYLHIPPKPCLMQGPFRLTARDFFCASNTRNTGIIAAAGEYVVFVDDLSVLMPGWMAQVWHAVLNGYCVCGAYKKVLKLTPNETGAAYEEFPPGVDTRWSRGSDTGIVPWTGGGLFGCSFGARTEDLLRIDGSEECCNGGGGEDYDMGIRLERAGAKIFYNRNMLTLESEEGHHDGEILPRERRVVSRDKLPSEYDSWPVHNQEEKYWSDHVLLNRVRYEGARIVPLRANGLREAREKFLNTGMVDIPAGPREDWRDGTPLEKL